MTLPYSPIATAYRPQRFADVVGQEAVVTTLKNAVRSGRLGNAYLFSGGRGTGKTTLARLLAKAMNCHQLDPEGEPCGRCASCQEIGRNGSLDLMEIDGASHRSIDDIRQIRETVGYSPASGKYKVYLIDEVHMLTKEAFNALLKTLEEPPAHVKFLFATTEPHKVPATVVSRCQRFQLRRISVAAICDKLRAIASDLSVDVDESGLYQIAQIADGGLRDAESLLDQVVSFHGGRVTAEAVAEVVGATPQESYFRLDRAMASGETAAAFQLAEEIFTSGRDIPCFVEGLIHHVRRLLVSHLSIASEPMVEEWRTHYSEMAQRLSKEQWISLLDELLERQIELRTAPSQRIALEMILLRYVQTCSRLSIEELVGRLQQLEQGLSSPAPRRAEPLPPPRPTSPPKVRPQEVLAGDFLGEGSQVGWTATSPGSKPLGEERNGRDGRCSRKAPPRLFEDAPPKQAAPSSPPPQPAALPQSADAKKRQNRYDTLLRFAAVELEGTVQKHG